PQAVIGLPNLPRASGSRLFAGLTMAGSVNIAVEWQGQSWAVAVNSDTIMPNGQVANSIAALDVNARGDVLFQYSNAVNTIVVRRAEKYYQVQDFLRPRPMAILSS